MFRKKYFPNIHEYLPLTETKNNWSILGNKKNPISLNVVRMKLREIYSKEEQLSHIFGNHSWIHNNFCTDFGPNIKLGRSFGMEFTFEKYSKKKTIDQQSCEMSCALLNSLGFHACADCGNVVEVPTPILYHSNDAALYFKIVRIFLGNYGYVTKNDWSTGGGCHVHLERKSKEFAGNLFRIIYNRPWLNYVFQDWYDYDTSLPLQYFHSKNTDMNWNFEEYLDGSINVDFDRESIIRHKEDTDTLELRFFDMPENVEGINTILKTTKVLCDLAKKKEEVEKISKKTCLERLTDGTYLKEWLEFKKKYDIDFGEENIRMRMLNMGVSKKKYEKILNSLVPPVPLNSLQQLMNLNKIRKIHY